MAKDHVWDLIDPRNYAEDQQLRIQRLNICRQCDHLNKMEMCNFCGCFMPMKTKLEEARCPIGKW
jgi:hypothetical protein